MLDLYTSIIFITVFILVITIADVYTNRLLTQSTKKSMIVVCLLIMASSLGEYVGVMTNGANEAYINLHEIAKLLEFCCAPAIGVAVALAYGYLKKTKNSNDFRHHSCSF